MAIDLHLHTNASDGTLSPQELLTAAAKLGLSAVSITDHDSTAALAAGTAVAAELGLAFIPGVELSASYSPEISLHILGYGIDPAHPELRGLGREPKAWDQSEEDSIAALEKRPLKSAGPVMTAGKPTGSGRGLYNTLKEMAISDVNEYFDGLLRGRPAYITITFTPPETVFGRSAGRSPGLSPPRSLRGR